MGTIFLVELVYLLSAVSALVQCSTEVLFESFNTVICFLLPHTQHEQGKVIVRVYIYVCVCDLKRLNHTLVVSSCFQTLTIDR